MGLGFESLRIHHCKHCSPSRSRRAFFVHFSPFGLEKSFTLLQSKPWKNRIAVCWRLCKYENNQTGVCLVSESLVVVFWRKPSYPGLFQIPEVSLWFLVCSNSVRYILYTALSETEKLRCCHLVATLEQWQLRICTTFSPATPSLSTDFSSGFWEPIPHLPAKRWVCVPVYSMRIRDSMRLCLV